VTAELIVRGRVATLAGSSGFGWADALAIAAGRVLGAGTIAEVDALAGRGTRRIELGPDEVAVPGLTDAHLHLAGAAVGRLRVDLEGAATLADGLALIRAAHAVDGDEDRWIEGYGWDPDRWGRWPTAGDLEAAAPGGRAALWAHDQHSLWVSTAALEVAGVTATTLDPAGGAIRRDIDGRPTGILHEAAARLVSVHVPPSSRETVEAAVAALAADLVSLGVVAAHDPGELTLDPSIDRAWPAYRRLSDDGRLPIRLWAGFRPEALDIAIGRRLRTGDPLGEDPDGHATIGWLKLFTDGSMGSRTARLYEPVILGPGEAEPPGGARGIWFTAPAEVSSAARRAADAGIATMIHAIGDEAVTAALDALEATAGRTSAMPRVEHVQLALSEDLARFGRAGIAASVQPCHLHSDADKARAVWGRRADDRGYPYGALAAGGALIPFGTDAPTEPIDPWPGIAMAVTRRDPAWNDGRPLGPGQALTLDRALRAACLDPALTEGTGERGRLVSGRRADLVVIPAIALDEPVEPGGPLATARPRLVLIDGRIVFEA
jgi:predicted amidohydrolase YtcJ